MSLNKNALSEEFSFLILKVTNICEGKLTNISFKEDGKIIVTRDFSNRKLRSKKKDIIETELDINEIRQVKSDVHLINKDKFIYHTNF